MSRPETGVPHHGNTPVNLTGLSDVDTAFKAIDLAISLAPEDYQISDIATHLGTICFSVDDRIVIATHKMSAPTASLPNARIAHIGDVMAYDLTSREIGVPNNVDRDLWHLYRTEDAAAVNWNAQASEQRRGSVKNQPFSAERLCGVLDVAMQFGEVINIAEAKARLNSV